MWNGRLAEIWQLISTSPESFKGGGVWNVIVNINDGLKAVGYALLVLFFVMGVVKTCGSFTEMKKPEVAFKCFIRFATHNRTHFLSCNFSCNFPSVFYKIILLFSKTSNILYTKKNEENKNENIRTERIRTDY